MAGWIKGKPKSVDDYLSQCDADRRAALEKLRQQILRVVPDAEPCISYSMPAFRWHGKVVGGFLATSWGGSYYPFSGSTLTTLASDIEGYDKTQSALHFDVKRGLPLALVRKLLQARMAEILRSGPVKKAKVKPTPRAKPAKATPRAKAKVAKKSRRT